MAARPSQTHPSPYGLHRPPENGTKKPDGVLWAAVMSSRLQNGGRKIIGHL